VSFEDGLLSGYNYDFTWKLRKVLTVEMEQEFAKHCQDKDAKVYGSIKKELNMF
jgi:hypothetical protein